MTAEEMTLTLAIEELHDMATSLEADESHQHTAQAQHLRVIADFLTLFGSVLKEGMESLTHSTQKGVIHDDRLDKSY